MLVLSPFVILQPKNLPALQSSFASIPISSRLWLALPIPCKYALQPISLYFRNVLLIFPKYCRFALIFVIQTQKKQVFLKIFREKFCQFGKKQYLCTRFRKNGARHHMEEGKKKEFFDKIYINRK